MDECKPLLGEPICDYFKLMENTGDDHNFVTALLANFQAGAYTRPPFIPT